MLWVFGIGVVVVAAATAVNNNQVPKTGFSCNGRTTGYYADVDSGCQVYHMCDGLGRQFSYTCPNATLFQQRMLICDHWYMVNCSKSVDDYTANLRIGRKMPFVDDSESNPYSRTPRPDLLSHPSQSEYDIIYRTGRTQFGTNLNLVGAETNKNNTTSTTDEPTYSLPSHWSTEYDQQATTSKPKVTFNPKKNIDTSGTIKGKPIIPISTATDSPVNFKSNFKATTPVFPTSVEASTEGPDDSGLLPPLPYQLANANLAENTEATPIKVNFQSEFKATTPVYPKTVDITSEEPGEAGVLPPVNSDVQPPAPPSQYYQPPKLDSDNTNEVRHGGFKALSSDEWEDLRKKFLIPDYEFPLESVSRPSYDSVLSSFQGSPVPSKKK